VSYLLSGVEIIRRPAIVVWVTGGTARVRVAARIVVGGVASWNEEQLAGVDIVRVRQAVGAGDSVRVDPIQTPNRGQGLPISDVVIDRLTSRRSRRCGGGPDEQLSNQQTDYQQQGFLPEFSFHLCPPYDSKRRRQILADLASRATAIRQAKENPKGFTSECKLVVRV
jgi:hypothetical protein